MITMLYEKMLTRKVVGLLAESPGQDSKVLAGLDVKNAQKSDQQGDQEKQSASMGKILNLMR